MLARSALGLVDANKLLPLHVVEQKSVGAMQHELHDAPEVSSCEWRRQLASHLLATCPSVRAAVASLFFRLRHASFLAAAFQSLLVACGQLVEKFPLEVLMS